MKIIEAQAALNSSRLQNANYPGRGMVIGLSPSGHELVQVYWTMGRSENSKNRRLIREDDHIKTVLKDGTLPVEHEDLIVYNASAQAGDIHIISNGRQTDTIRDYAADGKSFDAALQCWSFETDPPIFTPRISGLIDRAAQQYKLGIVKTIEQNEALLTRCVYSYQAVQKGFGHCIHTYDLTRITLPFTGEPYWMPLCETAAENADYYWNLLPADKRVGLYSKHINIATGTVTDTIVNQ